MVTICKLVLWLLTFGVAYFIQSTELIGLATAFFALHAAIAGLLLFSILLTIAIGREAALNTYASFLVRILRFSVAILITSILSFVATLFLTADFCTTYMLITLGQCMYNIDVVEESDFEKLKTKLKSKKKMKVKNLSTPECKKKQHPPVAQTIADKKVQQSTTEKKAVVIDIPIDEIESSPNLEIDDLEDVTLDSITETEASESEEIEPEDLEPDYLEADYLEADYLEAAYPETEYPETDLHESEHSEPEHREIKPVPDIPVD